MSTVEIPTSLPPAELWRNGATLPPKSAVGRAALYGPSAIARALLGKTCVFDNAESATPVAYFHGVIGGPISVSPSLVQAWLASPLVREIDQHQVKPGDIIALGHADFDSPVPTEHLGIIEPGNRIFHKRGSASESPFEIWARTEFDRKYAGLVPDAKYYRVVTSPEDYLELHDFAEAAALVERLDEEERRLASYVVVNDGPPRGASDYERWSEGFHNANLCAQHESEAIETALCDIIEQTGDAKHRRVLDVLLHRARELGRQTDAF